MRAYQTRRGGQHVARERGLAVPVISERKIVVIGTHPRFRAWMEENPKLAGPRTAGGCSNAICLSAPDQIVRALGVDIAAIVVLDYIPGMTAVVEDLRARHGHLAA